MEKGKEYEVFYKDDTQLRKKNLVFRDSSNGLLEFKNSRNNKIEIIPVHNIIRIQGNEGIMDERTKNNQFN